MKTGFTSTSFRQIRDTEKIVSLAVRAGADCIEWGGDIHVKSTEDAARVKTLCDNAGIGICSYGSYYRVGSADETAWENICRIASVLQCGSVRVWLGTRGSGKTEEAEYHGIVEDAEKICRRAGEYGLKVCPECHTGTYNDDTDAFLKIQNDIGAGNFGTYFQSKYKRLGYDLDRIERTMPYLESVHVSFSEQTREQFPKRDPAYIGALLEKLVSSGFDGNLLVEYTYLFSWAGIGRCMINDLEKIRKKTGGAL